MAEAILTRDGLDGLTMDRVAREMGFTKPAIYRYFDSKDALLAALEARALSTLHARVVRALEIFDAEHAKKSAFDLGKFFIVVRTYLDLRTTHPSHALVLQTLLGDPRHAVAPENVTPVLQSALPLLHLATWLLAKALGSDRESTSQAAERALLVFGSITGLLSAQKLERWNIPGLRVEPLIERLLIELFVGFGVPRKRVNDALRLAGFR